MITDSERLDWIATNNGAIRSSIYGYFVTFGATRQTSYYENWRDAIDEAMSNN